jgi:ribosomal protein S13
MESTLSTIKIIQTAIRNFSDVTITRCRSIIGTIVLLFNPLSLKDFAELLELKPSLIREVIKDLHSILLVPSKDDGIIHTFHASLHDFLMDKGRCSLRIQVQPSNHHVEITLLLFKCMAQNLKRDICEIGCIDETAQVKDLEERKMKYIGGSLSYACQYWMEHLSHISPSAVGTDLVVGALKEFVHLRLLYWIEVLSLLDKLTVVVASLKKTRSWHSVRSQKMISSRYLRIIYSKCRTTKMILTSY